MMRKLKRISVISLWLYLVFLSVSVLVPHEPKLATVQETGIKGGYNITGEVYSERGAVRIFAYNRPICVKVQRFSTTKEGDTVSSTEILEGIIGEDIPLENASWTVNWDAVVLAYVPVWLAVGFVYWIVASNPPAEREKQEGR